MNAASRKSSEMSGTIMFDSSSSDNEDEELPVLKHKMLFGKKTYGIQ